MIALAWLIKSQSQFPGVETVSYVRHLREAGWVLAFTELQHFHFVTSGESIIISKEKKSKKKKKNPVYKVSLWFVHSHAILPESWIVILTESAK